MKKKIIGIIMIGLFFLSTFRVGMVVGAASATPGSSQDPLITQSYLEKRLKEVASEPQSSVYKKLSITAGKELTVAEGGEFIIYSGTGEIQGNRGCMDLTEGEIISKQSSTQSAHNYLSLSSSGGVKAMKDCVIYVRGNYTIKG